MRWGRSKTWTGWAVLSVAHLVVLQAAALAQEPLAQEPLIKRLDGATRARVLAALAGLVLLGFAMVLLTWLGARIVQRYRQSAPYLRPTPRPGEHDWARKPLQGEERGEEG